MTVYIISVSSVALIINRAPYDRAQVPQQERSPLYTILCKNVKRAEPADKATNSLQCSVAEEE
eukprot:736276-Pyramimonas_sp.AAC.1